jgi:SSS family solute:Na+ symporter
MSLTVAIVGLYLLLSIWLGLKKVPKIKNLTDYALGASQFSTTALILSMIATFVDPFCTTGIAERGYSMGMVFTLPLLGVVVIWLVMAHLMSSAIDYLKANNCITLSDILSFYYGKWGKYVSLLTIMPTVAVLSIFYKSAAFILEKYLNMPFEYAAIIVTTVVALYSIFGGMHSVVVTDIAQFFVFMTVLPAIIIWGFFNIDISAAWNALPSDKIDISYENMPLFISLIIQNLMPLTGLPFIQRTLMCSSGRQVKTMLTVSGVFACLFLFGMAILGMVVYGMNPNIKSDDALFYFIDQAVPKAVVGFVAISFLAIIMSSASATLNSINVIFIKDIIGPIFPVTKGREMIITKLVGVAIVIISFNMIFVKEHIFDMLWTINNFWIHS